MPLRTVAALGFFIAACLSAANFKDIHKTLPLTSTGTVSLQTHKGSVHISTWDRAEVDVQARIEAEPGTRMNQRAFAATDVSIDSSPDAVSIHTVYPEQWSCCEHDSLPIVKYEIRMPRTAHLRVRDHRSDAEILDVHGGLDLDTHRGTAHVRGLSGPLTLATHRGDVKIAFASFSANSSVETHRGNVELTMPLSSRFDLQTGMGRHSSLESDFSVATKAVLHGGENWHGTVNGGGPSLKLQSHRGQIRLRGV